MLPKQTVNSILSGLEDKGFVEKIISPTDKRVKLLVLPVRELLMPTGFYKNG